MASDSGAPVGAASEARATKTRRRRKKIQTHLPVQKVVKVAKVEKVERVRKRARPRKAKVRATGQ